MSGRKRADIAFVSEHTVIEIKSLTNNRATDPNVQEALYKLIVEEGPAMGGPIIFGEVSVRLDHLPPILATNAFRILGNRVRREVTAANRQIKETIADFRWEAAHGTLLFVVPPMAIDLHLIGWTVWDAVRRGHNTSINSLIMIEVDAPDEQTQNLVLSQHSIAGVEVPGPILQGIQTALARMYNAPPEEMSEEAFFRRYEIDPG